MSEKTKKGKEIMENEEVILHHFYHEHPLTLTESADREYQRCFGCTRFIFPGETVYTCPYKCTMWGKPIVLHEECAEMPREIRLSMHPQHSLVQREESFVPECAVCDRDIYRIGYYCSNTGSCDFRIHVWCALNSSCCGGHPHQLKLLWRPGRSCLSRCDACGTIERGNSYICSNCNYWIHDSCATLPTTANYGHLHHHPLSLAYHVPLELIKRNFPCNICLRGFLPRYWVYHCGICRYVVHIKCAINAPPSTRSRISKDTDAADDKDVVAFPVDNVNVVEELIEPFVIKVGGAKGIPEMIVNGKYKFHNHNHELSLISLDHEEEEEEEEEYSDDDELNLRRKCELVCDGCTTPIHGKKHKFYMRCDECKYFLHLPCFNLPPHLPSLPLHHCYYGHSLILKTSPKLEITLCWICDAYTSGLFYKCTKCGFKADVKCACLPDTIKHAAHPYHHLKLLTTQITRDDSYIFTLCTACDRHTYGKVCYKCEICKIIFHASCISLPAAVTNPSWDTHPLPLTFDASLNHPSGFCCDVCEEEMNPRTWMYHCRSCDISFHPRCFPTASGDYRNVKFGQRYLVAAVHQHPLAVHQHPLAYQLLSKKLRCDVCEERKEYGNCFGFQCDKCDFFMCLDNCGKRRQDAFVAVD